MQQRRSAAGAAQRRQRELMAQHGWATITTFITLENKQRLRDLQDMHGLDSLHEALDLVLRRDADAAAAATPGKAIAGEPVSVEAAGPHTRPERGRAVR